MDDKVILANEDANGVRERSPISEPYPYVQPASIVPLLSEGERLSPDPLIGYRWDAPKAEDNLEIFLRRPLEADTRYSDNFIGLDTITSSSITVKVTGKGTLRLDFGTEFAGWLEIDSPDLSGTVTLGVSEYNQPAFVNLGPMSPSKTAVPQKYGNTYRLELNKELYEGVRFGFIDVETFDQPFTITDIRLVCQVKPVNYQAEFSCDNDLLTRIWYTAAYGVRVNLKKDYFAAILVDRGDRHSWTGDAYASQAASLLAFANYDFVLHNLRHTAERRNGIESYELYWILSLVDYYRYTGDDTGVKSLLSEALIRLDHAYSIYGTDCPIVYWGWDERLGVGFEHPEFADNQNSYKFLSIRAWKEFAAVLEDIGEKVLAEKYCGYVEEKTAQLLSASDYSGKFGMHTSAEAINAGMPDAANVLWHPDFDDRLNRLSYSPFNQFFLLQAMAKAGHYEAGISAVFDLWGGQIEYGGTTFFETFRPGWNDIIEKNGPPPNNQAGYTSLAHPWSSGVLVWLSEEVLGIKPQQAGFKTFSITPHLGRRLRRVQGKVPTPLGNIQAVFNLETGEHLVSVPHGTQALIGIPKSERLIEKISCNGIAVKPAEEDTEFVYIKDMNEGVYRFVVQYKGEIPKFLEEEYHYPLTAIMYDEVTQGNWQQVYGTDGYVLYGTGQQKFPPYVKDIRFEKADVLQWDAPGNDSRALLLPEELHSCVGNNRVIGCLHTRNNEVCCQSFNIDILLTEECEYTVALYFVDWDRQGRELVVEAFDEETLNLVAPLQVLHEYQEGVYLVYQHNRSLRFRINHLRGPNAAVSGLFFGKRE